MASGGYLLSREAVTSYPSRFLPTFTTYEGICLAFARTFLPKELGILSVIETILFKTPFDLVLSLFLNCMLQVAPLVAQSLELNQSIALDILSVIANQSK